MASGAEATEVTEITLGEVYRNLVELKADVKNLSVVPMAVYETDRRNDERRLDGFETRLDRADADRSVDRRSMIALVVAFLGQLALVFIAK